MGWLVAHYVVDRWSAAHVATWLVLGWLVRRRASLRVTLAAGFLVGLGWEVLELLVVEPVLGFHEPPLNRWASDPFFDLVGTALGAALARA